MKNAVLLTLCVVHQPSRVLLGMKKRGFGVGRWNGFGGHVESGETIEQAAVRELREEVGLEAVAIRKTGIIEFEFEENPITLEVHIFEVTEFSGEPRETDEMAPRWFSRDVLPFEQMWPDDIHWMPLLLGGKKFKGKFLFDRPSDAEYSGIILKKDLVEIEDF